MPAQLKSLEMQGYKTFANKTLFEFSDSITVIVGPNGSGKSNIADSIRWVLGEQSYSLLRGKRTSDMIFSGSEQRARSGMASATITFDNSNGWLPIEFTEVAITRRAYRDGHNDYLINGQRTRLRDVSELLAQSGLAERTYTIIGQGLVDAALALKAEERRRLFEEAAGIGLYRSRREEALRRLDKTQRNLERVHDILVELKPRLRSLERQARRSQEYDQVKSDLQVVLREWYGYHWHRTQEELASVMDDAHQQDQSLTQARDVQLRLNNKLIDTQGRIQALREKLNNWHRQSSELHSKRESVSMELAVIDERIKSLGNQKLVSNTEIARVEEELGKEKDRLKTVIEEISQSEVEINDARSHLERAKDVLSQQQESFQKSEIELQDARDLVADITLQRGELQVRLSERRIQIEHDEQSLQTARDAFSDAEIKFNEAQEHLDVTQKEFEGVKGGVEAANDQLEAHQKKIVEVEDQIKKRITNRTELKSELARVSAQLEVLDQADAALTGYTEGTRVVLQAAGNSQLEGILGTLNNQLEVPAELEVAITAVLGEYVDAVIVEGDSVDAVSLLSDKAKRGVLLPIDRTRAAPKAPLDVVIERFNLLGVAADLVECKPKLTMVKEVLLGRTLIARDRKSAVELLSYFDSEHRKNMEDDRFLDVRVVTLNGEIYYVSGPVLTSGVQADSKDQTLFSRARRRQELELQFREVDQEVTAVNLHLGKVGEEIDALRDEERKHIENANSAQANYEQAALKQEQARVELDQAAQEMEWRKVQRDKYLADLEVAHNEVEVLLHQLTERDEELTNANEQHREKKLSLTYQSLDEYRLEVSHWEKITAVLDQSITDSNKRVQEREISTGYIKQTLNELQSRQNELTSLTELLDKDRNNLRVTESDLDDEIHVFQDDIDPAQETLENAELEQINYQKSEADARQTLSNAEHQNAQARIALAHHQEALDSLRRRIEDDMGLVEFEYVEQISGPTPLPLDGFVQQLPQVLELSSDIEDVINRKRAQLRRVGPINPEAQQEYQEINHRYTFLSEQVADLEKAEIDVRKVIQELDELMEREFKKTFDAVAAEFRQIFRRLFNGGSAHLVMTDPDDISQSGIDIEAKLPGRRSQGLSLLSGGERSLTANALVFSLLKVSPTPFCLLDEVDAMLDESNLGRFREMLHELSADTQFIIVTHNRNTVQAADVIYGITMGRDSVSQVVSLKPDDVTRELA